MTNSETFTTGQIVHHTNRKGDVDIAEVWGPPQVNAQGVEWVRVRFEDTGEVIAVKTAQLTHP